MRLWQKLWLLFTVIWVVVAAMQIVTLVALEEDGAAKALQPLLLGIAFPAVLYAVGWTWEKLKGKKSDPE